MNSEYRFQGLVLSCTLSIYEKASDRVGFIALTIGAVYGLARVRACARDDV